MGPLLIVIIAALAVAGVAAIGWRRPARRAAASARPFSSQAALEVFETALILIDDGQATPVSGAESLAPIAGRLGVPGADAEAILEALRRIDPAYEGQIARLLETGEAIVFEAKGPGGALLVEGRAAGLLVWLKLSPAAAATALPTAERLAALLDSRPEPAWIADARGDVTWANRAWLAAAGAESLDAARAGALTLDRDLHALAEEAARSASAREQVRWLDLGRGRRALRVRATPLAAGGVGVWSQDITDAQAGAEILQRQAAAHELILGQIGDAVAIFDRDRRLAFHNAAFAALWDLEPAFLAERPSHAEWLDHLRQRRRLPETVDYAAFKARELARHGELEVSPETIWRLPDERTLRVVGQPEPRGGLTMLFSDITPELRLKTQFNHLIQVQKATLDKLTDAVAVFGADARLKLHNEAFERFWEINGGQLALAVDFDGVVDLCRRRVHDLQFWRELKGRITDPDPRARAAVSGELETADRRIVAHQSRPLPDGATLISFADVTDTRRLEGALSDREAALAEAERLKREFVGSVSYELRTPLTTILGYAELLEREAEALDARHRGHVAAIRSAAAQLSRSISDVLDMAEIDAGEMTLEVEDVDVATLIGGAIERWSGEAREGAVTLAAEGGGEGAPGLIRGDPKRLAEVLDHLTENALRHTPPGGAVTLLAEHAPGEIRLQVADTGRGIPFHVQAHIFDRFGRQDRGGPGLGLALVKALVELHGGWVALESEPGAGATFTCHLPEMVPAPDGRPELF
jgi:signal transduction histidine kinase